MRGITLAKTGTTDARKPLPSLLKDAHTGPTKDRRNRNLIFRRVCLGKGSSCRFELASQRFDEPLDWTRRHMIEGAVGAPAAYAKR
jgi:hypothetical protein